MALSQVSRGALGVVLLLCSNAFMNTAWYMHLKVNSQWGSGTRRLQRRHQLHF